jgi:hypothetical protein
MREEQGQSALPTGLEPSRELRSQGPKARNLDGSLCSRLGPLRLAYAQ